MNERSVFLAALELPDLAERAAYLDRACGGDSRLRRDVEALLAANERSGEFLEAPACGPTLTISDPAERPGSRLGPYKLLQRIGEGGMGVVFMAEQEEPVRRTVALKIMRQGMDSKAVLARFEAERQALALMDHPNIARVLDVGATDSGLPYFVMELVKGVPITRFCDENHLGLRERLELFVPVCQAIQHAHQKGIIHRDIKPTNVLVALYDDRPVPKVIDFGVAKATSQKLTERTLFTAFGSVVGTLEYMSPEQARLNQLDIDTRSDVYALGVLLYELITGTTPLDRARLKAAALDEVLRLIREEEPVRPSTRLSSARTQPEIAAAHRAEPNVGKALRGELDWIVMKALEKDRARRYETANGLARDVQRFLQDEPVEACPPTLGYRLRKAYRKNRVVVGVVTGFVGVVAGAAVLATVLAIQALRAERVAQAEQARAQASAVEAERQRIAAERERQRAEEEKRSAQAVRDFLQDDLLGQASAFNQAESRRLGGGDFDVELNPTIGELLDRAAVRLAPDRIDARFPNLPFIQAEVLKTVGSAYHTTGFREKGIDFLRRANDLYAASRGLDDPAALDARHTLAEALWMLGRADEAESLIEAAIADKVRVLGPHHPETINSQILRGALLLHGDRNDEAAEHYRMLAASARQHLEPDHLYVNWATINLAEGLSRLGRHDEAIAQMENVLAGRLIRDAPLDHPGVQAGIQVFAEIYKRAGRPADATRLYRDALVAAEVKGGPRHPATWLFRHVLGHEKLRAGDRDAAMALFQANLPIENQAHRGAVTRASLAQCFMETGRIDEALTMLREALDIELARHGASHRSWWTGKLRARIGQALLARKAYAEAEPLLVEGYRELNEHRDEHPPWGWGLKEDIRKSIVALFQATQRPDDLAQWERERLQECAREFDELDRKTPRWTPQLLREAATLALEFRAAGRKPDVIPLFERVLGRIETEGWRLDESTLNQCSRLCLAVAQAGRHDLAAKLSAAIVAELRKRPDTPRDHLARHLFALGHHRLWGGHAAEAEAPLREALAYQAKLDPNDWQTTKNTAWLAIALRRQNKFAGAEPLLLQSASEIAERFPKAPAWEKHFPGMVADELIKLYTALDRQEEVTKWQAERAKWPAR